MVQLMDLLTPPPSVVNAFCTTLCQRATRGYRVFLPTLSKTVRSLNRKNLLFFNSLWRFLANKVHSEASKATLSAQSYPRCEWCMATEGYQGSQQFPATTNHRVIRMNLDGESWGFPL